MGLRIGQSLHFPVEALADPFLEPWALGRWDELVPRTEKSLQEAKLNGDRPGTADILTAMAFLYLQTNRWADAVECLREEIQIRERIGDLHGCEEAGARLLEVMFHEP